MSYTTRQYTVTTEGGTGQHWADSPHDAAMAAIGHDDDSVVVRAPDCDTDTAEAWCRSEGGIPVEPTCWVETS